MHTRRLIIAGVAMSLAMVLGHFLTPKVKEEGFNLNEFLYRTDELKCQNGDLKRVYRSKSGMSQFVETGEKCQS